MKTFAFSHAVSLKRNWSDNWILKSKILTKIFFILFLLYFFLGKGISYSQQNCGCDLEIPASSTGRTIINGETMLNNQLVQVKPGQTVCLMAGTHNWLEFINFKSSSASARIKFKNCGGQVVIHTTNFNKGIQFKECVNFTLTGSGSSDFYGIHVEGQWNSSQNKYYPNWGVELIDKSTDFEIERIKVTHPHFSAFNVKDDIDCNDASNRRGVFTMRNLNIHDNLIEDCFTGEGFYIGYTFYFGNSALSCSTALPHEVENVELYRNKIYRTGREGIQIGSSPRNIRVYDNIIVDYGLDTGQPVDQRNAIQLGLGTSASVFNNYIKAHANSNGGAIKVFGPENVIFNNIIIGAKEMGIYTHNNSFDHMKKVKIYNNTIINPVGPAIDLKNDYAINYIKNNIIVRSSGTNYIVKDGGVPSQNIDSSNNFRTNNISGIKFQNAALEDYHLTSNSPLVLREGGVNLFSEGVTLDLDYKPRPSSGPGFSLGVFQYSIVASIETKEIPISNFCNTQNTSVNVPFIANGTFASNNTFTAQLSNSSGNFTSPTDIGTSNSSVSGTINAIVPSELAIGSNYRIRVIGSNPSTTGSTSTTVLTVSTTTCPREIITGEIPITIYCDNENTSVSVPFTVNIAFNSGNNFTAQISNSSGSFSSPTPIGTLTNSTGSGTVSAIVPSGLATGSGYRIRVIGSNPSTLGIPNTSNLTVSSTCPREITTGTISPSSFCTDENTPVFVPFTVTKPFNSGNTFTAQLSDSSGSFTSPETIGILTNFTGSGTISATISAGTPVGSAYRIRVIGSDPVTTGSINTSNLSVITCPYVITTGTISGTFCDDEDNPVSVPFTVNKPFNIGNKFTAQLSNSTGSFSSPIIIGSLDATSSGTISAIIDSGMTAGTSYRIRVIASNPSVTGTPNTTNLTISSTCTPKITTGVISPSTFCNDEKSPVAVPFTVNAAFNSGNTFTAQLSNSTGSFSSPVTIGTLTSTSSGTINATMPSGTSGGSGYRIRVIGSNPSTIGDTSATFISVNSDCQTCEGTGTIRREMYTGISGSQVSNLTSNANYPNNPSSVHSDTIFESPTNFGDNYGQRVSGYVCPPTTGWYYFYISGNDNCQLWLSTNDNPAKKVKIAEVPGFTGVREWNKYTEQKSVAKYLVAGLKYYIEALHKESSNNDNLAVGWELPDGTLERPMPGKRLLSPDPVGPPTCSETGTILREYYASVSGDSVVHLTSHSSYPDNPTSSSQITIFEGPTNIGNNYGTRIRGFICVPTTGNYYFYISGNDRCELWLSTNDNPTNKVKVAEVPGFTAVREWDKYAAQKSSAISLVAGTKYYIEALHKEGVNNDNIAVGWELPNGTLERPIPGSRLLPPTSNPPAPTPTCTSSGTILREQYSSISGDLVSHLTSHSNYPNSPSVTEEITIFEGPTNTADNYGTRIRGLVCAPSTGNYYFYISGNDRCELWLSTNADPANKVKIADVPGFTGVREWDKYAAQKSSAISLVAGVKYYIEALHKEGVNNDNLAVGWELPGGTLERPIPSTRISPPAGYSVPTTCISSGTILREQYTSVSGSAVSNLTSHASYPNSPSVTEEINIFEGPTNVGDSYGTRIRGLVCAPSTGNYYFYISGNDFCELWLSTNSNPANKVKIADVPGFTGVREWDKYAAQKSAAISLVAGEKYYIEALHKEGSGNDNIAVGWELPNATLERPIPSTRISPPDVNPFPTTCTATGSILREQFNSVSGDLISDLTSHSSYPNSPSVSQYIGIFEGPTNIADSYGTRIRGFVCAPQTGNYYFYISGNDRCELWLSTSENSANKTRVCNVPLWTGVREWDKFTEQKSVAIPLVAGKRYYIEALHKEGANNDNLAVGWSLPDSTFERPIPGSRLAPWTGGASRLGLDFDFIVEKGDVFLYPNPTEQSFNIIIGEQTTCFNVQMVNVNGVLVKEVIRCYGDTVVDVSDIASGMYFVYIIQGDVIIRKKLVVTH